MVLRMIYGIHYLCSDKDNMLNRMVELYQQLLHRGYSQNILVSLFKAAIARAMTHTNPTDAAGVT
jgi:hypothetical protein